MQVKEKDVQLKRMLVVEDDKGIACVYRDMFRQDFLLHACETIGEAREALKENHFDLVLLDLGLPDGSGLSLLVELRRRCPGLPVIVVSGDCYGQMAKQVMDAGAVACFVKPFESDELEQAVAGVVC